MHKTQPWWKTLLGGILLNCLAVGIYYYLRNGESKRILAPIAFLYELGGIWAATLPFAGFGMLMIGIALRDRQTQQNETRRKEEQPEDSLQQSDQTADAPNSDDSDE